MQLELILSVFMRGSTWIWIWIHHWFLFGEDYTFQIGHRLGILQMSSGPHSALRGIPSCRNHRHRIGRLKGIHMEFPIAGLYLSSRGYKHHYSPETGQFSS